MKQRSKVIIILVALAVVAVLAVTAVILLWSKPWVKVIVSIILVLGALSFIFIRRGVREMEHPDRIESRAYWNEMKNRSGR